jgi:hypothetical protein
MYVFVHKLKYFVSKNNVENIFKIATLIAALAPSSLWRRGTGSRDPVYKTPIRSKTFRTNYCPFYQKTADKSVSDNFGQIF